MGKQHIDALALYRGAFVDKDPAAIRAWARMKQRRDELKAAGMPHSQAVDQAMAEL